MKLLLTLITIFLFTGCNNSSSSNTNSNTNTTTSTQKDMRIHPDGTINIAPSISGVALTIVDENSLYDFTPKAVDEYKDTILTFSITNKPEWATFDTTTGNLNGTPSFTDGERYANVVISVSDEIHTSSLPPFDIVVTNINRIPIITSNEIANVQENQLDALTVTATDEDEDTLIYSLSGIDADAFNIDELTGLITFKIAPDFENPLDDGNDNIYLITVTVSDDIDTVTQDIIINILDVNESPTITSNSTVNVEENTQFVLTITATDIDNNTLLYSISGGVDQALFTIDANSGVLSFLTGRDFENPTDDDTNNTYIVNVTATDDGTGNLTDTQTITVTVTDVVENQAPVITSNATQNADENQTDAFTITATDVDADTLTYSLTGVDSKDFSIDATTGVVTFTNTPDFETPTDSDNNNTYEIVANVFDGTVTTTQNVVVTVNNILVPTLANSTGIIAENSGQGSSVGDVIIVNVEESPITAITLSGTGNGNFTVSTAGVITVATISNLDYEETTIYNLDAVAVTAAGNSNTIDVDITVTNIGDHYILKAVYDDKRTAGDATDDRLYLYMDQKINDSTFAASTSDNYTITGTGELGSALLNAYEDNIFHRHSMNLDTNGGNTSVEFVENTDEIIIKTAQIQDDHFYTAIGTLKTLVKEFNVLGRLQTGQTVSYESNDDGDLERGETRSYSTDVSSQVVTDNVTGLIWQKDGSTSGRRSWDDAVTYCEGLTLDGNSDFRLPTINELATIIDRSTYSPAINTTYFTNTYNGSNCGWGDGYWTSTIDVNNTNNIWVIPFQKARSCTTNKVEPGYADPTARIRCVR